MADSPPASPACAPCSDHPPSRSMDPERSGNPECRARLDNRPRTMHSDTAHSWHRDLRGTEGRRMAGAPAKASPRRRSVASPPSRSPLRRDGRPGLEPDFGEGFDRWIGHRTAHKSVYEPSEGGRDAVQAVVENVQWHGAEREPEAPRALEESVQPAIEEQYRHE